ncbi:rho guanine nucleotide exchange factor 17 isoform X2 [Neocloeon triangulifer]|uniref:rho guanine nucleotide exchange factor 17 isoform X2 n=1 Tax=Neocloeon triangulifer TaxID=2078957 RepID=UPI00286F606E|nr:rho guanine nucleotide exchange factor 17 isoform X2 [Neocloeon triangulifer]
MSGSDLRSVSRSVREKPDLPATADDLLLGAAAAPLPRHARRSKGARLRQLTDRLRHNSVEEVELPPRPLPDTLLDTLLPLPPLGFLQIANESPPNSTAASESLTEELQPPVQAQNADSLSEGETDSSVCSSTIPAQQLSRRYNKRPLRGPYGQILEAEMKRASPAPSKVDSELGFLQSSLPDAMRPPTSLGASSTSVASSSVLSNIEGGHVHQRAASSPCQMVGLEEQVNIRDTRTHVVYELYETEKYYVEALRTLIMNYMVPLKDSENLIEPGLVDEIFFQIPSILHYHEIFLDDLQNKLDNWDWRQRIGDIFLDFSQKQVVECYTEFINNWQRAKSLVKSTSQTKPAFGNFLEAVSREHKGKLTFDALLIMPVQRIPRYELLIQALLKHTSSSHPDYSYLVSAQRAIHALAVTINCKGRASCNEDESRLSIKEIENFLDGCDIFPAPDRTFLRHDLVTVKVGDSAKERMVFLFSDLMVVAGIKRRGGPVRKTSSNSLSSNSSSILECNKFKVLMKIPLSDVDFARAHDEAAKLIMHEITEIKEDTETVNRIIDLASRLHCSNPRLEEILHEMQVNLSRKLLDKQLEENGFHCLALNVSSQLESIMLMFEALEQKEAWENILSEAKQKMDQKFSPQFLYPVTIRKTRSGLQFTCASATANSERNYHGRDMWICNSDGYVGQVCVLHLADEPKVLSTNEVCESRILCMAAAPPYLCRSAYMEDHFEEYREPNSYSDLINDASNESTMWLGTEDGNILVYGCRNVWQCKMKMNLGFTVFSIMYLDNRVYASLANGSIVIYTRNSSTRWDWADPLYLPVSSPAVPVTKMVQVGNGAFIWCACNNIVYILNTKSLQVESKLCMGFRSEKSINCISCAASAVWISLQNSSIVRLYNGLSMELLSEINVAQNVTAMLKSCDDIIRQHKAACLRVTALVAHQDLLWVGTSAGVILKIKTPSVTSTTSKLAKPPLVKGISRGHTGHVRFLTTVEVDYPSESASQGKRAILVISGGDGYEDFRCSNVSELSGREDSTNHLLVWRL